MALAPMLENQWFGLYQQALKGFIWETVLCAVKE